MVKVTGPCLSTKARGQIGHALIFASSKGRAYAKRYRKPAQPNAPGQLSMRAMTSFLTKTWSSIPPAVQATWSSVEPSKDLPLYNRFLSFNLKRHRDNLPPTGDPNRLGEAYSRTWSAFVITPVSRGANMTVACLTESGLWGILYYRDTADWSGRIWSKLVHVEEVLVTGVVSWTDRPLAPDWYKYKAYSFGIYGLSGPAPWSVSVTVS